MKEASEMMIHSLILFFVALSLLAQDVTDVAVSAQAARLPSTVVASITADSGDKANCKIIKLSGSKISANFACSTSDSKTSFRSGALNSISATVQAIPLGIGDVFCLIGINPTVAAVTMGSLGSVPPNGISWSCTTAITGGGQTAPTSGTVVWP